MFNLVPAKTFELHLKETEGSGLVFKIFIDTILDHPSNQPTIASLPAFPLNKPPCYTLP